MKVRSTAATCALLTFAAAHAAAAQTIPPAPNVIEFLDGKYSVLAADYRYELSGRSIVIPRGFVTDFASVPSVFHSLIGPRGRHSRAALIHDYLYWTQRCSRQQSDNIMRLVMEASGVEWKDRTAIFKAVDWAGGKAWHDNERRRRGGELRFVPATMTGLADAMTWGAALQRLRETGTREPDLPVSQAFCELGGRN